MTRREANVALIVSSLTSSILSKAFTLPLVLSTLAMSNAAALASTPVFLTSTMSSGALGLFSSESLSYEVYSFFDVAQGLSQSKPSFQSLLNPGADLDLTTTTDFEDLAAPASDLLEFTDQDRAMAADYMSSAILWNGAMGGLVGATLYATLATDFWSNTF